MRSTEIRKAFIDFFEQKGHKYVAAASIVHKDDPTLMFTNAGMNQFKHFFLAPRQAPHKRAVSIQPCLRVTGKHNDLEEVGTDTYHHTLFEMLGNWSFGDYFKQEAIQWAWELLTTVYNLPVDRLYVTIFGGDVQDQLAPDEETKAIWEHYVTPERLLFFPKKDNFWSMADVGPCGPCTEIHIDLRPDVARKQIAGQSLVNQGHPQVIELWNLVFMQYNRLATGQLEHLPAKHVDTGLGLERLAMALQAKDSSYASDLFTPLIAAVTEVSGKVYGQVPEVDIAIRVVVDHLRAVVFAIADGQAPSHVKAGYVVRRILRRAVRYGHTYLGLEGAFLYRFVDLLTEQLQDAYPHLQQQRAYITRMIRAEETTFLKTLTRGLHRLDQMHQSLSVRDQATVVNGPLAFELYDTYGFPLDLTVLIAKERGWSVDKVGFEEALQVQRQRAQQAAASVVHDWVKVSEGDVTSFVGYDRLETTARIVQYRKVNLKSKAMYQVVLDQTPFYPEGGGQIGDTGKLIVKEEEVIVLDTHQEDGFILHNTAQLPTDITAPVQAVVDASRRTLIASNHTATHLLHAALKQFLGPHVEQRGSLVNEQLLRFDFSHTTKLTPEELAHVERTVNQRIRDNLVLQDQRNVALTEAKAMGASALFGERYGEQVRVITFDPAFSVELCGGTHVSATGKIGFFKITSSAAVAAGVYRITAVTAVAAEERVNDQIALLHALQDLLKDPSDPVQAMRRMLQERNDLGKKVATYEASQAQALVHQLRGSSRQVAGIHTTIAHVTLSQVSLLKQVARELKKSKPCFIVLTAAIAQRPHVVVGLSEDLACTWPYDAQAIVKKLAVLLEGGGGGDATFATAGGKQVSGLPRVLEMAEELLRAHTIS